ncbi:MAG: methyl-accepting chemotaxis protein [Burkholderiales bacterium]
MNNLQIYLQNFSIRIRFYIVMGTMSLSLLVLGAWGWYSGQSANKSAAAIFDGANAAAIDVANLREAMGLVRRWELESLAVGLGNTTEIQRLIGVWQNEIKNVNSAADKIKQANAGNSEVETLVDTQKKLIDTYATAILPVLTQVQNAVLDPAVALAYTQQQNDTHEQLKKNTEALLTAQQAVVAAAGEKMASTATAESLLRLGLVAITMALLAPLLWLTLQSVCRPLDRAVKVAQRIATGDLSEAIAVKGHDEMADLLRALNAMQASLSKVVGEVRDAADSIRTASTEVSSGNLDLSQRTEQTASNLQRTSSSMTDLTNTVQQSAASAKQANLMASSAAQAAAEGGTVVAQVVSTMNDINISSQKIAAIIAVIDGIAFQTNILALNAAVEAARAGEQGRGFAVVAGEVRGLASSSAEAAKEIKALIETSVSRVEMGSKQVAEAGKTMNNIVSSVQMVSDIIGEITVAAAEQSDGIGRINASVSELDQMTQQNAALVEQAAAAADSLKEQAQKLSHVVATFRLHPATS